MDLADDASMVGADPHAAVTVAAGLGADRTRPIPLATLDPEHQSPAEEHQRQGQHGVRRVHGSGVSDADVNADGSTSTTY